MTIAVIANPEKYAVHDPLITLFNHCRKLGIDVVVSENLREYLEESDNREVTVVNTEDEAVQRGNIIVAVGGDGTMLYTTRLVKYSGKPMMGINCGRLGFMANIPQDSIRDALRSIAEENYVVEDRFMLKGTTSKGETYHALNELLFTKKDTASLITLTAEYNGKFINEYWCDGLIVSTPTGSTAYNLSSGGPIVMPNTPVMIVTPISPHTLTTRPLVLPADQTLTVKVNIDTEHIIFSYDGVIMNIDEPLSVDITNTDFAIKFIQLPGYDYFKTLRKKLMWGLDHRQKRE